MDVVINDYLSLVNKFVKEVSMSKRKKQSANLNKQSKVKREKISKVIKDREDVKVIVFYNGPNCKVKISIPKRSITKKMLKV